MGQIMEEVILNCSPEKAFSEIADMQFVKKINPNAGIENEVIYQNKRLVRYKLKVSNVGVWESERIIIPESLTILTQRRNPLAPFKYMTVLHVFKKHESGTLLRYMEEFEMDSENIKRECEVLNDIFKKIGPNMKKIEQYFNKHL